MVDLNYVRKIALSFADASEEPHFEKTSFRVKRKIFATVSEKNQQLVVKLSPIDQSVFIDFSNKIFVPATGMWGKQGWTMVDMKNLRKTMLKDLLKLSYALVNS